MRLIAPYFRCFWMYQLAKPQPQKQNRTSRSSAITALIAVILISTPCIGWSKKNSDDRVATNTRELERVRSRIRALQSSLKDQKSKHSSVLSQLRATEQKISELARGIRNVQASIRRQENKVTATRAETVATRDDLNEERRVLARQIRSAYIIGRQERTKLVLNQEDPDALGRVFQYYDYVNRARSERIGRIQRSIEKLAVLETRLGGELQELNVLKDDQEKSLATLEAGREQRNLVVSKLEERISDQEGRLQQLRSDEVALEELLGSLRDVLADIPIDLGETLSFPKQKGKMPWPAKGRILASFNSSKGVGDLRWKGIWISAKEGKPVSAIAGGRVAYVGWMHRYGLIVVLEHGDSYFSLYGHNQTTTRNVGEWVGMGETIATVGDTGGQPKSGVYLEIRKGKKPINPKRWLKQTG